MYQENKKKSLFRGLRSKIQYLSENCSLQWIGYVFTPFPTPLFRRFFWLVTILACGGCSAVVLQGALSLYTEVAVSYSVETNYLEWDTPFPALTVCEQMKEDRIEKYLQSNHYPSAMNAFVKDVSFWNPKYCKSCTNCVLNHTCIEDFMELVERIRLKCNEMLTECSWNGEVFPCCDSVLVLNATVLNVTVLHYSTNGYIKGRYDQVSCKIKSCSVPCIKGNYFVERFRPVTTEYGTCYVFNSRLTGNGTIITVNRQDRLPTLTFSAIHGIHIRIHSPDDMISVATENILSRACSTLPLVSDFEISLMAEQTISDVSVQPLSPDSRDCLFKHERPDFAHLWPFASYSYSACELYCRAITQAEVCNCTHHFMPQIGDIPKCDINGLACLNTAKKTALSTEHFHCPMGCEEVMYKFSYVTCPREISKSNRSSKGLVRFGSLPALRVRRHAIRELLGLVVDVGGVIGVFFGASLLSIIEVFYILFLRNYP